VDRKTLYSILIKGHFLPTEAKRIAYATVNSYDREKLQDPDVIWQSGLVQKAIRSRTNFVNNLRAQGWSDRAIVGTLSAWYRGRATDSSSWAFLRKEYSIPTKEIHTYKLAVRARAKALVGKLSKATGTPYGRKLPKPSRSNLTVRPQDRFPSF
jgi:hypothetical protein